MKIFFDTEFTGLHQNTTLISIGLIEENGRTFYAEFSDYNHLQVDKWIEENVIKNLRFHGKLDNGWINCETQDSENKKQKTEAYGDKEFILKVLDSWINEFDNIEVWSDCLSYDWVLFNQLWGHAFNIPKNIYYIPFDLCTLFKMKGIDPDINRELFAGVSENLKKHDALFDAIIIKKCYEKLCNLT